MNAEDEDVEQVLLVKGDHVDVNNANADVVNDVNVEMNEDNPEQILLTVVTKDVDVEHVLLMNVDRVDVNTGTEENADGDTETLDNADVNNGNEAGNANKTKVRSIEALVCGLRRAREQELLQTS